MNVNFHDLQTRGYIEFTFSLISCTTGLRIEKPPVGALRCKIGESPFTELDPSQIIFPVNSHLRAGESLITLRQYIAPALANRIAEELTKPEYSIAFYFQTLTLNIPSAKTAPTRIVFWDGISCRPGMTVGRIHEVYLGLECSARVKQ